MEGVAAVVGDDVGADVVDVAEVGGTGSDVTDGEVVLNDTDGVRSSTVVESPAVVTTWWRWFEGAKTTTPTPITRLPTPTEASCTARRRNARLSRAETCRKEQA